ncbi:MAG TPA: DUF1549 domain-containing protein, partial [Isosphaeraceae bacterium]
MSFGVRDVLLLAAVALVARPGSAAEGPLHERVDALIDAAARGRPMSPPVDDAGFLRRLGLDLTGAIPTAREARAFLDDPAPEKRARLIDRLLDGPEYPRRMQELVDVMFMERLGENPEWAKYLRASFAANKPWDRLVGEILRGDSDDEAARGAAFFYAKRLEHYGENPVDYPALTRDVGRLFLGIDLRCAQCHDHLFIADYTQRDFQGLHAFFRNIALRDVKVPSIVETPTTRKMEYMSVFTKVAKATGPRIPGLEEIDLPALKPGDEYLTPPDPKTKSPGTPRFRLLEALARRLPTAANPAFARNLVNRLWFVMMGRGLVHPLDQFHAENPPSHPELLDLLASEFVRHGHDGKWLLRELARTRTYQRSDILPADADDVPPESFRTALEKRLAAEQLLRSMLVATGSGDPAASAREVAAGFEPLKARFLKAFANEPREPEDELNPSLRAALFVQNDRAVLDLLTPRPDNLVDRLAKQADAAAVAAELYVSILTRRPSPE